MFLHLSVCSQGEWGLPNPLDGRPPWMQTPLDADSPGCRPLRCRPPAPGFRYSQQAGGTQPTGLHTCFVINLIPADVLLHLTNMAIYPRTYMYQAYANISETRMHSSRMRTAHSSVRLLGGCLPQCMLGCPWVWAWRLETPPKMWPRDCPRCGPGDHPRCGPGHPPCQTPHIPAWVWAWDPQARPLNFPLGVWAWRPPRSDPSTSPLGVGLETTRPDPSTSPLGVEWRPARHAGIPPPLETCRACWDTRSNTCWDTIPPVNRMIDRHV